MSDDLIYGEMVEVSIKITAKQTPKPNTTPSHFDGKITACSSGFSTNFSSEDETIKVPKGNERCLVKLDLIVINGETYETRGTEKWVRGSKFDLSGDKGKLREVEVVSQLTSPVSLPQSVSFLFSNIKVLEETKGSGF